MGGIAGALGINPIFLVSQIVNFVILFGLMGIFLWRPLMKRLDERREMLTKQEEDAEAIAQARTDIEQERARALEEARKEADQITADARRRAREVSEQATADARKEAESILAQARIGAEEERNRMMSDLREQIAALAIAAAYKLVGDSLDEKRQRALVDEFFSGVREGRVEVLPEDAELAKGPVVVTSAVPLSSKEQSAVTKDLTTRLGDVDVSFQVDPNILGGLTVQVGDQVVDGSLAGQLGRMRQTLV